MRASHGLAALFMVLGATAQVRADTMVTMKTPTNEKVTETTWNIKAEGNITLDASVKMYSGASYYVVNRVSKQVTAGFIQTNGQPQPGKTVSWNGVTVNPVPQGSYDVLIVIQYVDADGKTQKASGGVLEWNVP